MNDITAKIFPMSAEYRDYLHDETKTVGRADSISFPQTEEDIRALLRRCAEEKTPVTVQGNRTGLTAGAVPDGGHIMSLSKMDQVLGMRLGEDDTVYLRVQPGLSLGVLRQMIAAKSFPTTGWDEASLAAYERFRRLPAQYFPPDPTETSASIGGMVSCNSSGAKTYHYGATRPYIQALRLVLADGDVLRIARGENVARGRDFSFTTESGRVISGRLPGYTMPRCKNASGYYAEDDMDLLDLFVGADGTLGVLSEIELRLIPMPQIIWGVNCFFRSEATALDFVEAVGESCPAVVAVEYFDSRALDILRGHDDGACPVPTGFDCMIYVELHAEEESLAAGQIKALGALLERLGADSGETWAARSQPDRERLLTLRHKVPESVNALIARRKREIPGLAKVGSDMAVPDAAFRACMAMYHRDLAAEGLEYAVWGHIGNRHLHVNVLPRSAEEMLRGKEMFVRWAQQIVAMGGTVSAEHGTGKIKTNLLQILYGEQGLREMAAVKRAFDPGCRLSPGNLFPADYV